MLIVLCSQKINQVRQRSCIRHSRHIRFSWWGPPHYADYCLTNVSATYIPIDTLVNTALNIEDYEYEHKYTNGWDMMRLDDKIVKFVVN